MPASPTTLVIATVARILADEDDDYGDDENEILPRQVLLTQTITYADHTATTVVTLGNGSPSPTSTAAAAPPISSSSPSSGPSSSSSSGGSLSPADIGAIIGSVLGAVILILLIWVGCVVRKRMAEATEEEDPNEIIMTEEAMLRDPRRFNRPWPVFPRSITPPMEPQYRARPVRPMYTANGAARRATTSYIYYEDQR
ncbi:hypothetical protein F5Y16DRAFT_208095 [Xylariaceae sp. FL0255]|nr:hypothetical protein F5Y16DRAFT_208095 [Xylariaceae sp. FL0255]